MSTKNILQELFRQKCISYTTSHVGGSDHKPEFRCIVTVDDLGSYIGQKAGNRIDAEKSASADALKYLSKHKSQKKILTSEVSTVYLIDLENVTQGASTIEAGNNVKIIGFLKFNHPLINKFTFPIELAHSVNKDAVDILMIIRAVDLAVTCKKIVFVTRDHFAHTFKEVFSHNIPDVEISVITGF